MTYPCPQCGREIAPSTHTDGRDSLRRDAAMRLLDMLPETDTVIALNENLACVEDEDPRLRSLCATARTLYRFWRETSC